VTAFLYCEFINGSQLKMDFLAWNIKGLNSQAKWDAIRNKIAESNCAIVCLQETKRASFDNMYLRKFCPCHLDSFAVSPSAGASRFDHDLE
jgi:hypothetical protein